MEDSAEHFFTSVATSLISEVPYPLLIEVSQLAQAAHQEPNYKQLKLAIQKLQWVKLSALRALAIDQGLSNAYQDKHLLIDPFGQADHAKSIFELVSYGKSVTDAISNFLNDRWKLGVKKQSCDLKWLDFQKLVAKRLPTLENLFSDNKFWLDKDARTIDSLIATRDEWLHRGSPLCVLIWPPSETGALQITRSLDMVENNIPNNPDTTKTFISTKDFVELHYNKLAQLTVETINLAITEERKSFPDFKISRHSNEELALFPTRLTRDSEWIGMQLGPFTRQN
jgi:hypothetical protein